MRCATAGRIHRLCASPCGPDRAIARLQIQRRRLRKSYIRCCVINCRAERDLYLRNAAIVRRRISYQPAAPSPVRVKKMVGGRGTGGSGTNSRVELDGSAVTTVEIAAAVPADAGIRLIVPVTIRGPWLTVTVPCPGITTLNENAWKVNVCVS